MRHGENSKIDYVYTVSYLVWRTYTVYSMSYTAAQKWRLADSSTSHSLCRRNSLFEEAHALKSKPTQLESLMSTGAKVQYRIRIQTYYDGKMTVNSEVDQSASTHFSYSSVQNEWMHEWNSSKWLNRLLLL